MAEVLLSKIICVTLSNIMKRKLLYITLLFMATNLLAEPFYTHSMVNNIRTLQVRFSSNPLALPVIELESEESVSISFDEMSYEPKSFNYSIIHCDADWTRSSLQKSTICKVLLMALSIIMNFHRIRPRCMCITNSMFLTMI